MQDADVSNQGSQGATEAALGLVKAPVRQDPRPPVINALRVTKILDTGFKNRQLSFIVTEVGGRIMVTCYQRTSPNQANCLAQWDIVPQGRDERNIIELITDKVLELPELA